MDEASQTYTNVPLLEGLGKIVAELMREHTPNLIVSENTPFLNVVSHVITRELQANRATAEVDLGVLKIEPEFVSSGTIAFIHTYPVESTELVAIKHHLQSKSKKLILVRISAEGTPEEVKDFTLNLALAEG
jgi:hypothetical protein